MMLQNLAFADLLRCSCRSQQALTYLVDLALTTAEMVPEAKIPASRLQPQISVH